MWRLIDSRPWFGAVLFSLSALCAWQSPRTGADLPAYAPTSGGIVFAEIARPNLPAEPGEGARLILLAKNGSKQILTGDFDSAADPAVSFDGKWILFAARKLRTDLWNIFEIGADGRNLRQVTKNLGNCRKPMYQSALFYLNDAHPSYQITFVTDVDGEIDPQSRRPALNLYSVRFDGSGLRRLTYGISSSIDPFQMDDGRILFSKAQPAGAELFAVQLDGTDVATFSGPQGKRFKGMPCTTAKRMVVFVESDRATPDGSGSLATLSLRRNLHSYRPLTTAMEGLFHSPSPLPDGSILVSRRPAAGVKGTYAIYRVDVATGQRSLVYHDAGSHAIQAVALVARHEPDGHSSVVEDDQNWSKIYGLNVYESDLKREWLPVGTAQRIRVIEGVPQRADTRFRRRLLGDVALEPDGSFHLSVPPNTPIQVQIEDGEGMALRTSSWFWTKNKENRGCIGCHEDGERTPANIFAKALSLSAANLTLPPERRRSVDFVNDVAPILQSRCAACHATGPGKAKLVLSETDASYRALGKWVEPGQARTSRLIWALFGRNTARPWDRIPATTPLPRSMPPNGSPALSADERKTIIEWIDLGAQFDASSGEKK